MLLSVTLGQQPGSVNGTVGSYNAQHTGLNSNETTLTPTIVANNLGLVWESPILDSSGIVFGSPLYVDNLAVSGTGNTASGGGVKAGSGLSMGAVLCATNQNWVYAIKGIDTNGVTGVAPGTILWKSFIGTSAGLAADGLTFGIMSTPVIDLTANRIYVCGKTTAGFQAFSLNLSNGAIIGSPLTLNTASLVPVDQNPAGTTTFTSTYQRGALNLSPDGHQLYVTFGEGGVGWLAAVNTTTMTVSSSFASGPQESTDNGGMWSADGAAVNTNGNVYVPTGNELAHTGSANNEWGDTMLEFTPGATLSLIGTYTPWNYNLLDTNDVDLGGDSPIIINLDPSITSTPTLIAQSSKQGDGYLINAGNMPGLTTKRPPTTVTPNHDPSLLNPNLILSYYSPAQDGPQNLFGPYSEATNGGNYAKARTAPATFTFNGKTYVVWSGSSKTTATSDVPTQPSMALTQIITSPGSPAYLSGPVAHLSDPATVYNNVAMLNPGNVIVTSNGTSGGDPIAWVYDTGTTRFNSSTVGIPTLYAFDAITMQELWTSSAAAATGVNGGGGELDFTGRYNGVISAHGLVFDGTDRIEAFGVTSNTTVDDSVQGAAQNQFTYAGIWSHQTAVTSLAVFQATQSVSSTAGATATITFTGSQFKLYAVEVSGYGTEGVSIDGGAVSNVSLNTAYIPHSVGPGVGNGLVYTSPVLANGTHTVVFSDVSGTVDLDRVVITPNPAVSLGVSMTDGVVAVQPGQVLSYTINYDNTGNGLVNNTANTGVVDSSGTTASGVVLTETLPANTTADLADSTAGWTQVGSTNVYTYTVGTLNGGDSGSVVFSVNVNPNFPDNISTLSNTVTISDSASDTASGSRTTAVGVFWTGVAGNSNWSTPGNWSGNLVPTQTDHVTIGASFSTIQIPSGTFAVHSLIASSPIEITAGTLVLNGAASFSDGLTIDTAGTLKVSADHVAVLVNAGLTIASGGIMDLADNALVVRNSDVGTIKGLLATGFNAGLGYWNGTGIISSTAASNPALLTTLGEILNVNAAGTGVAYGSLDGLTGLQMTDVLVKYTYYGDANLDGIVDGSDYSRIDNAFLTDQSNATAATGWGNGDFNYDGVINGSDYTLIDNAFNSQGASLAAALAANGVPTITAEVAAPVIRASYPFARSNVATSINAAGGLDIDDMLDSWSSERRAGKSVKHR